VPFSRTEPNVPGYEEVPNSPFTGSGSSSHTFTASKEFEQLLFILDGTVVNANNGNRLRLNNDTGGPYNTLFLNDTRQTAGSAIKLGDGLGTFDSFVIREERINIAAGFRPSRDRTGQAVGGTAFGVSPPITSVTVFNSDGSPFEVRARVYGLEV